VRCGTGLAALLTLGLPILVAIALSISVGLCFSVRHPFVRKMLGASSTALLALVGIGLAFVVLRMGRPDSDAYVPSLPVVGDILEGGDGLIVPGSSLALRLERAGTRDGGSECRIEGVIGGPSLGVYETCPRARLRVDATSGFGIVETRAFGGDLYESRWTTRGAFRLSDGVATDILITDVKDGVAPPVGWVAGSLLGGLAALAFLVFARRSLHTRALGARVDAWHEGGGWVRLDDDRRVHVEEASAFPVGPVSVAFDAERSTGYREDAARRVLDVVRGETSALAAARAGSSR
jgi:hypothetical protein